MKIKIIIEFFILIGLYSNIFPQTLFRSGMFLLHSTGSCIYWSPDSLATTNIQLEIPSYNLSHNFTGDSAFTLNATWFPNNPIGNEWYDWHRIFDGDDINNNIQPFLQNNKIIVIKSCYTSSLLDGLGSPSDTLNPELKSVYNYKWHWRSIIRVMEQHPENFFAIWTNAPNRGGLGELSHIFSKWAKDTLATGNDPDYGAFPSNVYVFDFFHKLTSPPNWLLPDEFSYWNGSYLESHPNGLAANLVAPQFVQEIFDAAIDYEQQIVPVELTSFSAIINSNLVNLIWQTATELNNLGFEIQRSYENEEWENIGFVRGNGTSAIINNYSFLDPIKNFNQKYYYRLKQINNDGTFEFSDVIEVKSGVPTKSELYQNYPNPFNPNTEINFLLTKSGYVKLIVYNSLGAEIANLIDGFVNAGNHSILFKAENLSSGIYFYTIISENFTSTRKMLLIK